MNHPDLCQIHRQRNACKFFTERQIKELPALAEAGAAEKDFRPVFK